VPRLLLVTDRRRSGGRDPLAVIGQALDAGLPALLLRDKDLPDDQAERYANALRDATRARGAFFFVAGRAELAARVGADGVHLGEGIQRPSTEVWDGPLSVAAHDLGGLERAGRIGARFALLSPLFATTSHPDARPLGPDRFQALAAQSPAPVLALGGVTPANTAEALAAGAFGVACMDAILAAEDPAAAVRAFLGVLSD
jgi:thiamine-phosphate diphosphorylase